MCIRAAMSYVTKAGFELCFHLTTFPSKWSERKGHVLRVIRCSKDDGLDAAHRLHHPPQHPRLPVGSLRGSPLAWPVGFDFPFRRKAAYDGIKQGCRKPRAERKEQNERNVQHIQVNDQLNVVPLILHTNA